MPDMPSRISPPSEAEFVPVAAPPDPPIRVALTLRPLTRDALYILAEANHRTPSEQVAWLVQEEIVRVAPKLKEQHQALRREVDELRRDTKKFIAEVSNIQDAIKESAEQLGGLAK